jgi:hypothetical protein
MSRIVGGILVSLSSLWIGCQHSAGTPEGPRPAIQRIAGIDVNPSHYPSLNEYHARVYQQVEAIVGEASTTAELKALFVECSRRLKAATVSPQERLGWIDPHGEARTAIVARLAELRSDEAVKVLVALYADDSLGWDGESGINVCNAISRFGRQALPHLAKQRRDVQRRSREVVACIEKGEIYGP